MNKKRFIILMAALLAIAVPIFAESTTIDGMGSMSVNPIKQIMILCTGIIPGIIVTCKFVIDVVNAMMHREQDPTRLQKAIIGLVVTVGVIVLYVVLVQFVFGSSAADTAGGGLATGQFFEGLTGESVSLDALKAAGYAAKTALTSL